MRRTQLPAAVMVCWPAVERGLVQNPASLFSQRIWVYLLPLTQCLRIDLHSWDVLEGRLRTVAAVPVVDLNQRRCLKQGPGPWQVC